MCVGERPRLTKGGGGVTSRFRPGTRRGEREPPHRPHSALAGAGPAGRGREAAPALSGGSGSTPARRCGREAGGVRAARGGGAGAAAQAAQQRACAAEPSNQGRPAAPRPRRRPAQPGPARPREGGGPRPGLPGGGPAPGPRAASPAAQAPPPRSASQRAEPPARAARSAQTKARPGPAQPARPPASVRPAPAPRSGPRPPDPLPLGAPPGPARGQGPRPPRMGKSNSKLKPEIVEELTRKTYCECAPGTPAQGPSSTPALPQTPRPCANAAAHPSSLPARPLPGPTPGPIVPEHPAPHTWGGCRLSGCEEPPPAHPQAPLCGCPGRWSQQGAPGGAVVRPL